MESFFITPLRTANPPVISLHDVDEFIEEVFGNIMELRECNRRLLEALCVRQREQAPVIQRIGDILLEAATEFREFYPMYVGHHPLADKRLKDEIDRNPDFRLFIEVITFRFMQLAVLTLHLSEMFTTTVKSSGREPTS